MERVLRGENRLAAIREMRGSRSALLRIERRVEDRLPGTDGPHNAVPMSRSATTESDAVNLNKEFATPTSDRSFGAIGRRHQPRGRFFKGGGHLPLPNPKTWPPAAQASAPRPIHSADTRMRLR